MAVVLTNSLSDGSVDSVEWRGHGAIIIIKNYTLLYLFFTVKSVVSVNVVKSISTLFLKIIKMALIKMRMRKPQNKE